MAAEPKSIVVVLLCLVALAASVLYSIHHPETGDDMYETQPS